ncbi:MAG TPA: TraR/DksA C4-type zinc finger protein [Polyangiales bacterium]|jgi:DnaK suppressor protein
MAKDKTEAGLDANQQAALKKRLLDARSELTQRRAGQLERQSALRSEVEDEGDSASRANNEDTLITLAESERDRVGEIDRALAKFDSGEYGLDEETGEPIGFERLQVIPWARYSAATQETLER